MDDDTDRAEVFLEWYPNAVWVRSAPDCIERLSEAWDIVYFDYFLGGRRIPQLGSEDSGLTVAMHIVEHRPEHLRETRFVVHTSDNEKGRIMVTVLTRSGFRAEHIPYWRLLREMPSGR